MEHTVVWIDLFALGSAVAMTLLILTRVGYLKRTGVRVITLGYQKRGVHQGIEMLVLPLAMLTLLEIGLHAVHASWHVFGFQGYETWWAFPPARLTGVVCLAGAWLVLFKTLRDFGFSYRLGVDHHNPGALVTHGIFAYSRNPVYLSLVIFFLGQFLIYSNRFFFWMLLGSAGFMHFLARTEERQLAALHGETYRRYAQRVPRYFGMRRKPR